MAARGSKGKAKGKNKGSPLTSENEKIEKAANALKNSVDQFRIFINSMDHWVIKNRERALKIFQTFDVSDTGKITHDQFKAGLRDLNVFCNGTELHLLCMLLDRNNTGNIEYNFIATDLSHVRDREERHKMQDIRPAFQPNPRFTRCAVCSLLSWNGEPYREKFPRYVDVSLRLVTFDATRNHPAHICQLVHAHLTILHLTHIIRSKTSFSTPHIHIYRDRSSDTEPLPEEQSLEQCGYVGGPAGAPVPVTLYYDYSVDIGSGCPLVMSDHYFGQRRARVHRSTSALPMLSTTASPPTSPTRGGGVLASTGFLSSVRGTGSQVSFTPRQMSAGHLTA